MPFTSEKIVCYPWFDMELFLQLSQEKRLGGELMELCAKTWELWSKTLTVTKIITGKRQYLLIRLDDSAEAFVDEAWDKRPSEGHLLNSLAQTMCMAVARELLPEVEDAGCAPAPKPTKDLKEALAGLGVPYMADGPILSKRYAVLTNYPFKGGCEICSMFQDCPKGQGKAEAANTMVLPGFERTE